MVARRAIDVALDLARMPALTIVARNQALPRDVLQVIRIAAQCPEASKAAVEATQKPLGTVYAAAVFYLEEMLFFPDAGPYRNLGVSAGATRAKMRLHMGWLLRWLHPDHNSSETAVLLAARVIAAWHEVGRGERRDLLLADTVPQKLTSRQRRAHGRRPMPAMRVRWIAVPMLCVPPARGHRQRAVILVLAAAVVLALVFLPTR